MFPIRIERFPTIETQRLLLREIVVSDTEKLFALRNNPAVTQYLGRGDDKDSSAVEGMILKMHGDLAVFDSGRECCVILLILIRVG